MKTSAISATNKGKEFELDILRRMIIEISDYAIIRLDKKGIITSWNSGAEKIKGYSSSEIIGQSFERFYTSKDLKNGKPQRLLKEVDENNKASDEGWRVRKDGTKFWASVTITAIHNDDDEVCGYSKVTRDLTERKKAEEKMQLLHKAIDEIEDYAIILLDKEGEIINWNRGAENIKGYSAAEILGRNFRQFYPLEDLDQKKPELLLNIAAKTGRSEDEGWRVKKGGDLFWAYVTITAIHDEEGKVTGFSKVTRDLTERRKASLKLKKRTLELQAKNDELNQFAYIASHDLKEPLNTIQSSLRILKEDYLVKNDETAEQLTQFMTEATNRMGELIMGLLEYGRLGTQSELEEVDLGKLTKDVISDLQHLVQEQNAEISIAKLPVIKGYKTELRLLFQNLLSNAIKFHKTEEPPKVEVLCEKEGTEWIFCIRDNGIGIPQKHIKKLFLIFRRLHNSDEYEGTGIGLAHCKKVVEMHNGKLWVNSEVGKGSSFYFSIPMKVKVEEKAS